MVYSSFNSFVLLSVANTLLRKKINIEEEREKKMISLSIKKKGIGLALSLFKRIKIHPPDSLVTMGESKAEATKCPVDQLNRIFPTIFPSKLGLSPSSFPLLFSILCCIIERASTQSDTNAVFSVEFHGRPHVSKLFFLSLGSLLLR